MTNLLVTFCPVKVGDNDFTSLADKPEARFLDISTTPSPSPARLASKRIPTANETAKMEVARRRSPDFHKRSYRQILFDRFVDKTPGEVQRAREEAERRARLVR